MYLHQWLMLLCLSIYFITTLDHDLQGVGKRLRNKQDLQHLRIFASDRNQWRNLSQEIMKAAQAKLTHSVIVRQQRESVTDDDDVFFLFLCFV